MENVSDEGLDYMFGNLILTVEKSDTKYKWLILLLLRLANEILYIGY